MRCFLKYSVLFLLCYIFWITDNNQVQSCANASVGREVTEATNYENAAQQVLCRAIGFCLSCQRSVKSKSKLKTVFDWKQLDFHYLSDYDRRYDIQTKMFIPGVATPIDVDVYYESARNSTVFVTIPRFQAGIPATLGTVITSPFTGELVINPYPSWSWHRNPESCRKDRLVSVYRVKIDKCGRLWVLDTGRHLNKQVCPMQILAFDLRTNQLIHRHVIPDHLVERTSILVTPIVEVQDTYCRDTFVYIADCQIFSIIIYNVRKNISWKASDKTMYPFPTHGTFSIQGDQFDLMDGVLGIDLGPKVSGENRKLFYHSLSSVTQNWVYTSVLKNRSLFEEDPYAHPELFHSYKGTRQSQSAAIAIDRNGIAYFGQMTPVSLNCWNTATDFGSKNIDVIEQNAKTLQFASGIKVIDNAEGQQELWVLTSRLQKVITGHLEPQEINFRIQVINVNDAVKNTKCGKSQNSGGYNNVRFYGR